MNRRLRITTQAIPAHEARQKAMKPLKLTPVYAAAAAGALGAAVILLGCAAAPASNKPDTEQAQALEAEEARRAPEAEEAEAAQEAAREAAEAALAQLENPESSGSEPSANLATWLDNQQNPDTPAGDNAPVATPIHRAALSGSPEDIATLLEDGADPNAPQAGGYTPLHWAAARADTRADTDTDKDTLQIIDLLTAAGADPDAPSNRGYTPLHVALYADNAPAAERLVWHGADWERRDASGYKAYDALTGAAADFRERMGESLSLPPDHRPLVMRYGSEVLPLLTEYGTGAGQAYYRYGENAFASGVPSGPPNAIAEIVISRTFEYLEEPEIQMELRNTGEDSLYHLRGTLQMTSAGKPVGEVPVYLGTLPAGDTISRSFKLPIPGLAVAGAELDLTVTFSELNDYVPYPDPLKGRITINPLDDRTVLRRPELFSNREIRRLVEAGSVGAFGIDGLIYNELRDFSIADILFFAGKGAISPEVVEGLVADPAMGYTPGDILTLAEADYLSQNLLAGMIVNPRTGYEPADILRLAEGGHLTGGILEAVVVDRRTSITPEYIIRLAEGGHLSNGLLEAAAAAPRMGFTPGDILRLAEGGHLSGGMLEQLYLSSPENRRIFNGSQIQRLAQLELFRLPRIGFTYRIDDSDQNPDDPSDGVPDGRIQVREVVDVRLTFKNDSIFDLRDVAIAVESESENIDLFNQGERIPAIVPAAQFGTDFRLVVKPRFADEAIDLNIRVTSPDFGDLFTQSERIAVGREVGSPEIRISKRVISTRSTPVYAGAGSDTPVLADFEVGAEFQARGELGDFYRVVVFGDEFGWIKRGDTRDADENETGRIKAVNIDDTARRFTNLPAVNAPAPIVKPVVVIRNLADNAVIGDNTTTMEVEAIAQAGEIASIAVWVNDSLLPGSGERGLRVQRPDSRIQRSFEIPLRRGSNEIRVRAYNNRNIPSDERRVVVKSTGIENPPELYVLSVGVDDYQDPVWNLRYAAKDAEAVADIFTGQEGRLYEKVHTRVLTNAGAKRAAILDELTRFVRRARRQDVVMVFMAGHGVQHAGAYYFVPHDADPNRPQVGGIIQDQLIRELRSNVGSQKAIVMLDTCQSSFSLAQSGRRSAGTSTDSLVQGLSNATGLVIMSAAEGNQAALEDPKWGHGAFTLAIRRGLTEGRARDRNRDGAISWNELQEFVRAEVLELTDAQQRPKFSGENLEDFVIFAK